jgi:CBS domain-containing protein
MMVVWRAETRPDQAVSTSAMEELMNVARILKDKGRVVATMPPLTTLRDIVDRLAKDKIGAIVISDGEQVKGIISERDIVRILAYQGPQVFEEPVQNFMTKDVVSCAERDSVDRLMELMTAHRFRHMPVIENGRLVGIVSIGDVVKQRIALADLEAASMREYIATG